MAKLWKKGDSKLNAVIENYTAGTDYIFDVELLPFDIQASRAHAKMLHKIGILSEKELSDISNGLDALHVDLADGKIVITKEDEDCHTFIENYLVEKIGDAGKKIHTGRSRNDQVATAVRLYMREQLKAAKGAVLDLAEQFLGAAEKNKAIPMPGYSHTQQAMLTTVGHYYAAFAESLIDDAENISSVHAHINKNPLGSAAGFGTAIAVDRELTAKELGFDAIQQNTLYVQNARGKFESLYLEALAQVMLTLGKFANDTLLFTSQEFDYFSVDDSLVTGSSIMPHKRNLDGLEILRGNVSVVLADQLMVKDIAKNLLSGYNRDGQLIKKPLMEATQITLDSIAVASAYLAGISPKEDTLRTKIHPGVFTADIANALVEEKGMAFRDAYKAAASTSSDEVDLEKNIASKKTPGAPGNLALDTYRERIKQLKID